MKRNSATTRGLVELNGQQEQEEVRDAVAGDPSDAGAGLQLLQCASHLGPSEDAGEGSTGTKRGASKKYRTRQELQDENVHLKNQLLVLQRNLLEKDKRIEALELEKENGKFK